MAYAGPVTQGIIDACVKELRKTETKEKIMKNMIDPFVKGIFKRYSGFIALYFITHFIIIILLIYIAYSVRK